MSQQSNCAIAVIGIDIGKNSFHVVGHDRRGAIVLRQKWSRGQVETRLANMQHCLVGMEACVGAHHLSRKLQVLGHDARLMPAKYVRPYSKGQKNDFRDAEAIAEAVQRPTMKFVATKTVDQLDLQALHRVRERLVSQRTGTINQIRAFLLERGIAVRQGRLFLRTALPHILAAPSDVVSPRMVRIIEELQGHIVYYRASKNDCPTCSLKPKCTTAVVRKVTRDVHEDIRDHVRALATTESFQQSRRERKKVEMRFAHMKRILKLDRLRLRGLNGARDEVLLTATTQNLRRVAKLLWRAPPTVASACPALRLCRGCTRSRDHRRSSRCGCQGAAPARASSTPVRTDACKDSPAAGREVILAGCRAA